MAKMLIIMGSILVLAGIIFYFFPNAFRWFGRLPGDIRIEKTNSAFYFPITTMILLSIAISVILAIIRRFM